MYPRNTLIFALCALAGAASAQTSSVTMFGVVDLSVTHGSGGGSNLTSMQPSGLSGSRLGFRGVEHIDGDLSASFWLEASVAPDSGTFGTSSANNQTTTASGGGMTFGRRSTLSLTSKRLGELRMGRDSTPQYHTVNFFDPFTLLGVGSSMIFDASISGLTRTKASNSISYFTPNGLGGAYGQLQHYRGENPSGATENDGTGTGLRIGYANKTIEVAYATSKTRFAAGVVKQSNIGMVWNAGFAKLHAVYERDSTGSVDATGYLLGAVVPVGAGRARLAYSQYETDAAGNPEMRKLALGYVHDLSKRTSLYGTYARLLNAGGSARSLAGLAAARNADYNAYQMGINHRF